MLLSGMVDDEDIFANNNPQSLTLFNAQFRDTNPRIGKKTGFARFLDNIGQSRTLSTLSLNSQRLNEKEWKSFYRCTFFPSRRLQPSLVHLNLSRIGITSLALTLLTRSLNYVETLESICFERVANILKFFIEAINVRNDVLRQVNLSDVGQFFLKKIDLFELLIERSGLTNLEQVEVCIRGSQLMIVQRYLRKIRYLEKTLSPKERKKGNIKLHVT